MWHNMAIILTEEQANKVRGNTSPISALDPMKIGASLYYLPNEVLSDINHTSKFDILQKCENRELTQLEIDFLNNNGE